MTSGGVGALRGAIDELARAEVVGFAQRDDLVELLRDRTRLDAQIARRLAEFDSSVEWSVDGSRSAAGGWSRICGWRRVRRIIW